MTARSKGSTTNGALQQHPDESSSRLRWHVRPATMGDQNPVSRLLLNCYSTLLPLKYSQEVLDTALPLISQARTELLTSGTWYVVEHPDTQQLVGCGGWSETAPNVGSQDANKQSDDSYFIRVHLRHFASDPAFQRQGIASTIWKRICEDIHQNLGQPADETPMEVYSTLTAIQFYESLGFEVQYKTDLTLAENCQFPVAVMRRQKRKQLH